jgi:tRNA (cmo5U34)-methyltransferase
VQQSEQQSLNKSNEAWETTASQAMRDLPRSTEFHLPTKSNEVSNQAASKAAQPSSSSSDELANFFNAISDEYGLAIQRCVPRYTEMLWAIFEYLPDSLRQPKRVLELGCGTGNLSELIARNFPNARLTLVDLSDSSLRTCRSRMPTSAQVEYVHRDFRELVFADNQFDLILSTISLHHLNSTEKQRLFANGYDWLSAGGMLSYGDQFSALAADVYQRHMENWKAYTQSAGASEKEWQMWMDHQEKQDFHDSLPDQLEWLRKAGFENVDCTWRHLLWTVVQARRE